MEVVSASITYLRPPALAPATVRTTLLRSGRTAAHVRAVLAQGDDDLVDAVLVLGDLPDEPAVRYDGTPAFQARDPDDCVRLTPQIPTGVHVGILDVLDQRLDPATVPFAASPRGPEPRPNCGAGRGSPTVGSPMPCRCCSSSMPSRRRR